jgi:hypothetical protein
MQKTLLLACVAASSVLLASCATTAPVVPDAIAAPAGSSLLLDTLASGVQIYKCAAAAGGRYGWDLKAPEAILSTPLGRQIGHHFAGPTWELNDGSFAVGVASAKDPGPTPTAIAWLLLTVKSTSGSGVLTAARFVHRVNTVGGVAPANGCEAGNVGAEVRIPYSARYVFYK